MAKDSRPPNLLPSSLDSNKRAAQKPVITLHIMTATKWGPFQTHFCNYFLPYIEDKFKRLSRALPLKREFEQRKSVKDSWPSVIDRFRFKILFCMLVSGHEWLSVSYHLWQSMTISVSLSHIVCITNCPKQPTVLWWFCTNIRLEAHAISNILTQPRVQYFRR